MIDEFFEFLIDFDDLIFFFLFCFMMMCLDLFVDLLIDYYCDYEILLWIFLYFEFEFDCCDFVGLIFYIYYDEFSLWFEFVDMELLVVFIVVGILVVERGGVEVEVILFIDCVWKVV